MTRVRWRRSLSEVDREAVVALITAAHRADGIAPVGEQALRRLTDGSSDHVVITGAGQQVEGYLSLAVGREDDQAATAELVVHPEARRRGHGAALARAALDRSGGRVLFWAHGTLPAAKRLADGLGLTAVRELHIMRRSLRNIPEMVAPQGFSIRRYAGDADDDELLRVNNTAFSWHPEQGGWTHAQLRERTAEPWFDPNGLFLAVDETTGALLGFHWTKVHAGAADESGEFPDAIGEVYVLAVDPAAQGRGLGRALTLRGINHLAGRLSQAPDPNVILYVESDNAAAIRTYQGLGFTVLSSDTAYSPPGSPKPE